MENQQSKLDKAVKISIIAGIFLVALSISSYLIISLLQKEANDFQEEKPSSVEEVKKQSPIESDKVGFNSEPSEKSLKMASYYYYRMSKKDQDEAIDSYGDGTGSDLVAVRNFSLMLDGSPESFAKMESIIRKNNGGVMPNYDSPNTPNTYQDSTSELDNLVKENDQKRQQECQQDLAEYNACLSKYNSEMAEYSICLSEGKPYCSKPFSFCHKPFCF